MNWLRSLWTDIRALIAGPDPHDVDPPSSMPEPGENTLSWLRGPPTVPLPKDEK